MTAALRRSPECASFRPCIGSSPVSFFLQNSTARTAYSFDQALRLRQLVLENLARDALEELADEPQAKCERLCVLGATGLGEIGCETGAQRSEAIQRLEARAEDVSDRLNGGDGLGSV